MTRQGRVHDKDMRATEEFCRDKDFFVTTDLYRSKKKTKKRPLGFRASQLGIRAKLYKLPGTHCLVQASDELKSHLFLVNFSV